MGHLMPHELAAMVLSHAVGNAVLEQALDSCLIGCAVACLLHLICSLLSSAGSPLDPPRYGLTLYSGHMGSRCALAASLLC